MVGERLKGANSIFDRIKSVFEGEDIEQYNPNIHGPLVSFTGKMGYEELERYWVDEPYSFVVVLYNPDLNDYIYYIAEPELTPFEETFLKELKDRLQDVLLVEDVASDEDKEKVLVKKVKKLVKDYAIKITPSMFEKILYYIIRDFVKFG
ncbi:MAG: secretion system protein, partial [Methanosarcinales archaeon]